MTFRFETVVTRQLFKSCLRLHAPHATACPCFQITFLSGGDNDCVTRRLEFTSPRISSSILQVACLIRVPTEVVKQRAQASPSSGTYRVLVVALREEVQPLRRFLFDVLLIFIFFCSAHVVAPLLQYFERWPAFVQENAKLSIRARRANDLLSEDRKILFRVKLSKLSCGLAQPGCGRLFWSDSKCRFPTVKSRCFSVCLNRASQACTEDLAAPFSER